MALRSTLHSSLHLPGQKSFATSYNGHRKVELVHVAEFFGVQGRVDGLVAGLLEYSVRI